MKAFAMMLVLLGCSAAVQAQDAPKEISITPERISEPFSESIGNDPSDAPAAITTPVAKPATEINTTPERAKDGETTTPVVPVTDVVSPAAITETPVNAAPAKAVQEAENKGSPE